MVQQVELLVLVLADVTRRAVTVTGSDHKNLLFFLLNVILLLWLRAAHGLTLFPLGFWCGAVL